MGSNQLLLLASLFSLTIKAYAIETVRGPCDDKMWQVSLPAVMLDEPALRAAYEKMVSLSLSPTPTNCAVLYPAENGTPVAGPRTIVMDKQWHVIRVVNGVEQRVFEQHGLKFEYELIIPRPNVERRTLTWMSVCRTPEACQKLGIPFGTNED